MHEMMQEVSILGNRSFSLGARVVRAKDRGEVRLFGKYFRNNPKRVGGENDIRVYEEKN
jgi:hypothetical protein